MPSFLKSSALAVLIAAAAAASLRAKNVDLSTVPSRDTVQLTAGGQPAAI